MNSIGDKVGRRTLNVALVFVFLEMAFVAGFFFYFSYSYRSNIENKVAGFAEAVIDADEALYALKLRQTDAVYRDTLSSLEKYRDDNASDISRISMVSFGSTNNYYIFDTDGHRLGEKMEYDEYLADNKNELLSGRKRWRRLSGTDSTLFIPLRTPDDRLAGYLMIEMNDPMPLYVLAAAAGLVILLWIAAVIFTHSVKKSLEGTVFGPVRDLTEMTDSFIKDASESSGRLEAMEAEDEIKDLKEAIQRLFVNISNGNADLSEAVYKANHDAMTGMLNKRSYAALAENFKHESQLCVIYFDVNNLKHVNDNLGHDHGDFIIKQAAEYIRGIMSPSDYCFRMGGDEFLLVMTGCNFRTIGKLIDRLDTDSPYILNPAESKWKSALSYGYAYIENGKNYEDILAEAEKRMYIRKAKYKALMQMPER